MAVSCISTDLISLEWGERLGYPIRHTQISQVRTLFKIILSTAVCTHRSLIKEQCLKYVIHQLSKVIIMQIKLHKGSLL